MTENAENSPGFLPATLVLVIGSLVGLVGYLLLASAAGWISPIWWGGEALLFPLVFGVTVLVFGGVALCFIVRSVVSTLKRRLTRLGLLGAGMIIGALLMPVQRLIGSLLTAIPGWEAMAPMASVFVVLAVAAICSAFAASLLIALFPRSSA